ncbi:MAG TPA: hypothetical protein VJ302_29025 [Blastocatellia bacterium]|nr:hypothetical protein [Blastocatellia bacterium]
MKDISLEDCIELQKCFLIGDKFSPFEDEEDFRTYYPLVLIGEIGGVINLSCKLVRSPNTYEEEFKDEGADMFIYLLLFGMMLEIHARVKVFGLIQEYWDRPVATFSTEAEYYNHCLDLIKKVERFVRPGKEDLYTSEYFYEVFSSIQQVSQYVTKLDWQAVINNFHNKVIHKHSDPKAFTIDGTYNGSFQINIQKFLEFIIRVDAPVAKKRRDFLERLTKIQNLLAHL